MINEKLLAYPVSTFTPEYKFNTVQWTGNATARKIVGVGFQPDFIWIKDVHESSNDNSFRFYDSSRGAKKYISPDSDAAQVTDSTGDGLDSFDVDGFSIGTDDEVNENGHDFIAYCWQVNKGTKSTNSTGGISSTVQKNEAGGLSIVEYTGTGSAASVGHGLGAVPEFIIIKALVVTANDNWAVYHKETGSGNGMILSGTDAQDDNVGYFNDTDPTSSVFTVGTYSVVNENTDAYVAYCFDSVAGKSAFGSYTGSDSQGSPDIDIDFKPDLLVVKRVPAAEQWWVGGTDTNSGDHLTKWMPLQSNERLQTDTIHSMNLLSDGFEPYGTSDLVNDSGDKYLYMAWKKNIGTNLTAGTMAWLVVAGGASGGRGASRSGGGGGAGGLRTSYGGSSGGGADAENNITLSSGTIYTLTVGAGGASKSGSDGTGNDGADSSIAATGLTTITSAGGGKGGYPGSGGAGGSGGGGAHGGGSAGAGTANQGYAGGQGIGESSYNGGGGGGASAVGSNSSASAGGAGGNGLNVGIIGAHTAYAGGGGGGGGGTIGQGGDGGGGNGGSTTGAAGSANTGGGGGGAQSASGAGGTGIIALRLLTSEYSGIVSGSPTVTTAGSDTILKYTGTGKYAHGAFPATGKMSWLVIAGGGGGGFTAGGGGGAGGFRSSYPLVSGGGAASESDITLSAGTYTITIGAGGAGSDASDAKGVNGSTSTLAHGDISNIISAGGGGGGTRGSGIYSGADGGSGGGEAGDNSGDGGDGTANQGYAGGSNSDSGTGGAGGGGAGTIGVAHNGNSGGNGGDGATTGITGSNLTLAGGGGGGGQAGHSAGTGQDGGGNGGTTSVGAAGTANTGGGGGGDGNHDNNGGTGGSGVIILRLLTSQYVGAGAISGSPTVTTSGSYTILKYTGSGTYAHS